MQILDFPEIVMTPDVTSDLQVGLPAGTVAVPASPDLAKIDLTAVALAQYGDWRKDVAATKANLSTLVLDLSTASKVAEARTLRHRLIGQPLANLRKVAATIKSKMAQTSKAVGAELEKAEAAFTEADALILPLIEKREAELEAEREAARKAEEARKAVHEGNIARIRAYAVIAESHDMSAGRIANGIAQLEAIPTPTTEAWQEFAVPAADAICSTLAKMRALHAKAVADEAAAAEAERIRKENEELRAKLAAAEAERVEAEIRARQAAEARIAVAFDRAKARASHAAAMSVYFAFCVGAWVPLDRVDEYIAALDALQPQPITQDAQERGSLPAAAGACASTGAEAATSPGSGDEGKGAHAEERAPVSAISIGTIERGAELLDASSRAIADPVYVDPSDGSVHRFAPGPITMVEPEAPADASLPPFNLGEWERRMGFPLKRIFIEDELGIPHSHTEKASVFWRGSDFARICAALVEHINKRAQA